jgi:hypothetical protein
VLPLPAKEGKEEVKIKCCKEKTKCCKSPI